MEKAIEMGIGFVTGRANVCNIVNYYFKDILKQIKKLERSVNITIFILYDLSYRGFDRIDFYKIIPAVYKDINVKFITPENIEEEKKRIIARMDITKEEIELFLGNGHARGRNTLMHFAYRNNMDYLLFWDDDEYPVANIKGGSEILWKKQDNISMHLKNIENADVTIGYHCGYISPIPYIDFKNEVEKEKFKSFIEAISNEIVSWESIKSKMQNDNGITYAKKEIAEGKEVYELKMQGAGKWVAGSTLCLNLQHVNKIPAFYNPPEARGEDAFFSTRLANARVLKIPVYHFHDGFLMYTDIMLSNYPKRLEKAKADCAENLIQKRFFYATIGWIRYKPLLMYISDKNNYATKIEEVYEKLKQSIPVMNKMFKHYDFNMLLEELTKYAEHVEEHYKEYLKTNEIWNRLKR